MVSKLGTKHLDLDLTSDTSRRGSVPMAHQTSCNPHLSQTSGAVVVWAARLRHLTFGSAKSFTDYKLLLYAQGCWGESVDRCAHLRRYIFVGAMSWGVVPKLLFCRPIVNLSPPT